MKKMLCGVVLGIAVSAFVGLNGSSVPVAAQPAAEAPAPLTFELKKDRSGKYRFNINSGEHSLMVSPKGYEKKEDALKIIAQIKKDAGKAKIDDQTKDAPKDKN